MLCILLGKIIKFGKKFTSRYLEKKFRVSLFSLIIYSFDAKFRHNFPFGNFNFPLEEHNQRRGGTRYSPWFPRIKFFLRDEIHVYLRAQTFKFLIHVPNCDSEYLIDIKSHTLWTHWKYLSLANLYLYTVSIYFFNVQQI